jgi:DNA (cytosine-5)-methyltransferase 1
MTYKLLDLFCGQGGMAMGYADAGFRVIGVDSQDFSARYPYGFRQADALDVLRDTDYVKGFDAIHASPPCQAHSQITPDRDLHESLIEPVRDLLAATGKPYVIENVPGAPLRNPVQLCGSSFGLRVRRHRLFEVSFPLVAPPCDHAWQNSDPLFKVRASHRPNAERRWSGVLGVHGGADSTDAWADVMEIEHMTMRGLAQAIPPAYAEYIGNRLRRHLIDAERVPL